MADSKAGPGTDEEKKLMEEEEKPPRQKSEKKDGTRVFKKSSPNGKITVYIGKRDFVDHVNQVDPIDGVVLIDSDYLKERKVFAQVLAGFRYGRDDLDVLGLSFRRDLIDERIQVYPPPDPSQPQLLTLLQVRLMKKIGRNAYPFTFMLRPGLPSSVTLQPAQPTNGEAEKPCGVDYVVRCYVAKNATDKIEKRNSVRLVFKKIIHAPLDRTERPSVDVTKEFMLSSHPLTVEANLDKGTYYHNEPIKVNVAIANRSSRTVKKIRIQVRQFASICLFANSEYKCVVAQLDSDEAFPLSTGSSLQRSYSITPCLADNRDKRGLALDGQIKHEDTCLASSTIFPPGVDESSKETKENMGIMVHYSVKLRLMVALGSDVTVELPFTLTHPKPTHPVISQMITLPPRIPNKSKDEQQQDKENGGGSTDEAAGDSSVAAGAQSKATGASAISPVPSVHDAIDHNLITFDASDGVDQMGSDEDFVFEEFVRLRVAGMEEGNETEA